MDFYGILFDIKNGSKMPYSKNYFDTLFAAKLEELGVKTITGTLPIEFTSKGGAIQWTVYGNNTQHNYSAEGTLPLTFTTHTTGVADNWTVYGNDDNGTENEFDYTTAQILNCYVSTSNTVTYAANDRGVIIPVQPSTTYTLVMIRYAKEEAAEDDASAIATTTLPERGTQGRRLFYVVHGNVSQTFTTGADEYFVYFKFCNTTKSYLDEQLQSIILVKGSTAPDHYIPYQQGVGERTENLFDCSQVAGDAITVDGYTFTKGSTSYWYDIFSHTAGYSAALQTDKAIKLDAGTYTLSAINITPATLKWNVRYADLNGQNQADVVSNKTLPRTFTLANAGYVSFRLDAGTPTVDRLMLVEGSTAPSTYIPYGYQIPLTVSQTGQPDKNYDIYIGDTPLTAGQSISKTSTGVDLELFEGENTVSTTLYNKPETSITYTDYLGVGEYVNGQWQIPLTVTHYTDNIFDKDAKNANKGYEDSTCIMWAGSIPYPYMTGNIPEDNNCFVSEKIPASPNTTYYLTDGIFKNTDNGIYSVFLWNRFRMSDYQAFPTEKTFTTGDDTKFIQLCVLKSYADTVMITTKPTSEYIPHKQSTDYTIPIDAPLTEGQSVSDTVEITAYEGTNTLDTTLTVKPDATIKFK